MVVCAKCGAELAAGAEECPRCGAAVGSADAADIDEIKRERRKLFLVGFGCLFLGLLLGRGMPGVSWISFPDDGPGREWSGANLNNSKPPIATTAVELFDAFRDDEDVAEARFGDRPLMVTGTLARIDKHARFGPDLMLQTSNPEKPLRADLVRESRDEAGRLASGQTITVGCRHVEESFGPDPWLRDCRIQDAGDAPAARPGLPEPPAPPAPPEPPEPVTS